jgi:hypothetical protein
MREAIKTYMQPAFLICAAVLAAAGVGMPAVIKSFGVYLKKEPAPLKKSLELLDEKGLVNYKVISKEKIDNENVVKSLGTEDYIQWNLEDSEAPSESTSKYCSLFITYYKLPDRIPHVPEECYAGGGYQRLTSEDVTFQVGEKEIPGKYLVFGGSNGNNGQSGVKFPVLYFFNVNGTYATGREDARIALGKNIFSKRVYFCKVEWKFFNDRFGTVIYPDKEEAIKASQKLMGVILPILEKEHWPINGR